MVPRGGRVFRKFMVANSTVIIVIVLLLLGASILGDGLSGPGR
ncbi:hypothetical protein [Streptomyces collinus]